MHKIILSIIVATFALESWATTITNVAGTLSQRISDLNTTSLTLKGTLDARDFLFIAENLNQLSQIDMKEASIVAYTNTHAPLIGNQQEFEAATLPATCFMGKPLTRIVLPQDLKTIGFAAFAGCSKLQSIELPATLDSIGSYAFTATALTEVNLPPTITKMGEGAYSQCKSLTTAVIAQAHVPTAAFKGDEKLSQVALSSNVTTIGDQAFSGCTALRGIDLGNQSKLHSIGHEAFINTSLANANLSGLQHLKKVGDWAFANTPITQIKLPASVETLGDGSFYQDSMVKDLALSGLLSSVGNFMLAGLQHVNNMELSNNLVAIGDYAFYNMAGVQQLNLPSTLNYIGTQAMAGMTALKTIHSRASIAPELGEQVWAGIEQSRVELQVNSQDYQKADQWREFAIRRTNLQGDVNDDGFVNVADLVSIFNYQQGKSAGTFIFDVADLDNNGTINDNDATQLGKMALTQDPAMVMKPDMVSTEDELSIADIKIEPGKTCELELKLNNTLNYTALQCDLHLPKGMEIVPGSMVTTQRTNAHQFAPHTNPQATTRVLCYSSATSEIEAGDGSIMRLKVTANDNLDMRSTVIIDNIVVACANGESYFAAPTTVQVANTLGVDNIASKTAQVMVQGGVLIIESYKATTAQLVTLSGMSTHLTVQAGHNQYSNLNSGIYMIRIDGATHKVIIK